MKLFKPVIRWAEEPDGTRSFLATIVDAPQFSIEIRRQPGEAPAVHVRPVEYDAPDTYEGEPPDELVFLAGVMALMKMPSMTFIAAKTDKDRTVALGAITALARAVFLQIEYMPRAGETQLELFYQSDQLGLPPRVAMVLLGRDIVESLVTPESDLERRLREKYTAPGMPPLTPQQLEEMMPNELPPPSYAYVEPAVPDGAVEAFKAERERQALAAMPPAGTA